MALMISVSGVRGLVGTTLTPGLAVEFAQAFGTLLRGGRVVLGRDSRPSGEMFEHAVAAGLCAAGCAVTRIGIAMTPTVARAILDGRYAGGVNITASHNPADWNGIKFLDEHGLAPDPQRAREIDEIRRDPARLSSVTEFHPIQLDDGAGRRHVDAVLRAVEVDLTPLRGLRVVLDSVNGAGALHTPAFLAALGCEVIHLNAAADGRFAHSPEPIAENLSQLCERVSSEHAAIGFAQDPDADRLAIVDETGRYIGEEYTLALCAQSVLSRRRGPVAANLSTSRMIDDIAARFGAPTQRTPVGEAHVARAMMASGAVVGGEGNGGVIDPRISYVRDSLSAMSLVLQLMAATGKSIRALVEELPRFEMVKQKMPCGPDQVRRAVEAIEGRFAGERITRGDGVRIDFPEGWVHLRGSNTEPIVRVIAEARDREKAEILISRVRQAAGI